MPSQGNRAVIAAAGSGKTEALIRMALEDPACRVLITTYTNENIRQLTRRIEQRAGVVPSNVTITSWFSFLVNQCARPYQRSLTGTPNFIKSLNFIGERFWKIPRTQTLNYYFDRGANIYRNGASEFACRVDETSEGKVVGRLSEMFDHVYIDEFQDLVGYDLDFVDLLFRSRISVTVVGDPRQHTYATNTSSKNKKYRGDGLMDWLNERRVICDIEPWTQSYRCNQVICDWADKIYPDMPATTSSGVPDTEHDGVFEIPATEAIEYFNKYSPVVLRHSKLTDTQGLPAMNIGQSKGSTYDRVLIFPTVPMKKYLKTCDPSGMKSPEKLYVAVTRARYSVAFVV